MTALKERDEEGAEKAMRAHIQRSYERFAQFAKP
jgi:DNA-binding GntR family transcriptional regulator